MNPADVFQRILRGSSQLPEVSAAIGSADNWAVTLEPPRVIMVGPTLYGQKEGAEVFVLISAPDDGMPTVQHYRIDVMSNEWGTEVVTAVRDAEGLRITYADPG